MRTFTAEYSCKNPECEQPSWEITGKMYDGEFEPDLERETKCPTCKQWGE